MNNEEMGHEHEFHCRTCAARFPRGARVIDPALASVIPWRVVLGLIWRKVTRR